MLQSKSANTHGPLTTVHTVTPAARPAQAHQRTPPQTLGVTVSITRRHRHAHADAAFFLTSGTGGPAFQSPDAARRQRRHPPAAGSSSTSSRTATARQPAARAPRPAAAASTSRLHVQPHPELAGGPGRRVAHHAGRPRHPGPGCHCLTPSPVTHPNRIEQARSAASLV